MLVITWLHLRISLELHYTLMNTGSNQYSVQYSSLADSRHCPGAKGIYVLKVGKVCCSSSDMASIFRVAEHVIVMSRITYLFNFFPINYIETISSYIKFSVVNCLVYNVMMFV